MSGGKIDGKANGSRMRSALMDNAMYTPTWDAALNHHVRELLQLVNECLHRFNATHSSLFGELMGPCL